MRPDEARKIIRPLVDKAGGGVVSLSNLRELWKTQSRYDEDTGIEDVRAVLKESDPATAWAYLLETVLGFDRVYARLGSQWPPDTFKALETLFALARSRIELRQDIRRGVPASFDFSDATDPFGERWARSYGGNGDVGFRTTARPNHTETDTGSEPNIKVEEDNSAEIRRLLEMDATKEGLSFADYVASPGRGRASKATGARLDSLSRSVSRLLDIGFSHREIGSVIERDKRRMTDLVFRSK